MVTSGEVEPTLGAWQVQVTNPLYVDYVAKSKLSAVLMPP